MIETVKRGSCYILRSPHITQEFLPEQFETSYWRERPGYGEISAGRGDSCQIAYDGNKAILRRYRRGGAIGRVLSDQYLWMGETLSRPWLEWKILQRAFKAGLPVPEPIAACICRSGLSYRAALITAYLNDTETLTERLRRSAMSPDFWQNLGLLIKHMHAEGIRHADLTSDNVLIDSADRCYLIDFDKARVMNRIDDWQWRPLYRFQRSIDKRHRIQAMHFNDDDWQALMDGYQS